MANSLIRVLKYVAASMLVLIALLIVSSTLLTLFILPTLYKIFERKSHVIAHPLLDPAATTELLPL